MTFQHLLFVQFDSTVAESGDTNPLSLLDQLSSCIWARSLTDIGRIHSAPFIKIQIEPQNPLPRINKYPINKDTLQGIKLIIEDYKVQDILSPCTSGC